MNVSHLQACDGLIRCTGCGREFESSHYELSNPDRLIQRKESIAVNHTCKPMRVERPVVRVWQHPTGQALQTYYDGAVRRLMPA